jgi:hypothetical protein
MFDDLVSAVQALDEHDPAALTDAELDDAMRTLQRTTAMLEACTARVTGVWDDRRCWQATGARSGPAWLAATCRIPHQDAARQVGLARRVRHLPAAAAAWAAGDISSAHVHRLARARNPRTFAALGRDEHTLIDVARSSSYRTFDRTVAYWTDAADPDGADQSAQDRRDRRQVHLSESIGGLWFGNLTLDPISGAIVHGELRRLEADLFTADRAEARTRLGIENPTLADLARTPAQRRADALVEMARRSATAPADGTPPKPLFTVLVGYETFAGRICQLASTTPVAPGSLLPHLDDALLERVVFDAPGHVTEVSEQRCFTGLLRKAVQVRDQTCYHPACELPAEWCEIDHIRPAAHFGPTSQANGRPACGYHNRLRNRSAPTSSGPP